MTNRRMKRIEISPEFLFLVAIEGQAFKCVKGLPPDAEFRGISHDFASNTWNVFVSRDSFSEVEDGCIVPRIDAPLFRQVERTK